MFKTQFKFYLTVLVVLGASISLQSFAATWTPPASSPPFGYPQSLLSTGDLAQTKSGPITLNNSITIASSTMDDSPQLIIRSGPSKYAYIDNYYGDMRFVNNYGGTGAVRMSLTEEGILSVNGTQTKFSNLFPEYRWKWGGSNAANGALNWKKIAAITMDDLAWRAVSLKVDIMNAGTNFGSSVEAENMTFYVSCRRSTNVIDSLDDALVSGPVKDVVRVVKLGTGNYELQARQPSDWRHMTINARVISSGGGTTVAYEENPVDGSTVGTIYEAELTHHDFATNLDVLGDVDVSGKIGVNTPSPGADLQINKEGEISQNEWYQEHPFKIWGTDQVLLMGVDTDARAAYLQSVDVGTAFSNIILNRNGGNVGIGGSGIDNKLEIQNGNIEIQNNDIDSKIRFHDPGNYWYSMGIDQSDLGRFKIGYGGDVSSNNFVIDRTTARIGINTNAPTYTLDVNGSLRSSTLYYGAGNSRTETRADAGLQGDAGAQSGFFQTSAPAPAANWYPGATSWQHLLDVRHSNPANNYAMQFAGGFWTQDLYFRKTANNPATPWSRVVMENSTGLAEIGKTNGINGGELLMSRKDDITFAGDTLGRILFDTSDSPSTLDASAMILGRAYGSPTSVQKGGSLAFYTKEFGTPASGSATERMTIDAFGNVGINDTSPDANLDVEGTIRATRVCDQTGTVCKTLSTGWDGTPWEKKTTRFTVQTYISGGGYGTWVSQYVTLPKYTTKLTLSTPGTLMTYVHAVNFIAGVETRIGHYGYKCRPVNPLSTSCSNFYTPVVDESQPPIPSDNVIRFAVNGAGLGTHTGYLDVEYWAPVTETFSTTDLYPY
ncbi:hypothetical protein C0584_04345 [Candidatus Parcubacteria bacterium]|mgnify:CR=1 FL=1|nr:MAG: hypothetical protein C0584_04345 [Candidatus Parcubacteria bacterium]